MSNQLTNDNILATLGGVKDPEIGRDLVSLGMVKNVKRMQFLTVGGVQAYLRTSVVNRIRDVIRGSLRRGFAVEAGDTLRDDAPSPLERAIRAQRHDRFVTALQQLKPSDRQVIVWRLELGYSVDEIAPRLGKSKAASPTLPGTGAAGGFQWRRPAIIRWSARNSSSWRARTIRLPMRSTA